MFLFDLRHLSGIKRAIKYLPLTTSILIEEQFTDRLLHQTKELEAETKRFKREVKNLIDSFKSYLVQLLVVNSH